MLLKFPDVWITALALQTGSNFWFDMMNKCVNLCAAGKKPDAQKKDEK